MMNGWQSGQGGMYVGGGLLMLLTVLVVVALVFWMLRLIVPPAQGSAHDAALELLTRRYDAGEISAAEYEQARTALGR